MPVHDISVALRTDLPTWPGEQALQREVTSSLEDGDFATASHLSMSAHAGTHVDAPVHFIRDGGGIDGYPLEAFVGPVFVADLRETDDEITADDLVKARVPDAAERLIALTRSSGWSRRDGSFREDYVAFHPSAAEWCVQRPMRLVGIDYLSVETFARVDAGEAPVHETLLAHGVAILEGLDLEGIDPGTYELAALPLLVPGGDGAPARAVLTSI